MAHGGNEVGRRKPGGERPGVPDLRVQALLGNRIVHPCELHLGCQGPRSRVWPIDPKETPCHTPFSFFAQGTRRVASWPRCFSTIGAKAGFTPTAPEASPKGTSIPSRSRYSSDQTCQRKGSAARAGTSSPAQMPRSSTSCSRSAGTRPRRSALIGRDSPSRLIGASMTRPQWRDEGREGSGLQPSTARAGGADQTVYEPSLGLSR